MGKKFKMERKKTKGFYAQVGHRQSPLRRGLSAPENERGAQQNYDADIHGTRRQQKSSHVHLIALEHAALDNY